MISSYDTIKTLIRTEKALQLENQRQYVFEVASNANKVEIKKAVEKIYKVKVQDVNIISMPRKLKRVRQELGYTAQWKKAVVTLKDGQKIEVT